MKKFLFTLMMAFVLSFSGCKNVLSYDHVVTKIEIQNEPTKTVYNVGEEADWSGLEVKAIYFDGESENVEPELITGFDSSVAVESQTITVSYKEKTATFTITIKNAETNQNKTLSSIAITTEPAKLVYKVGDIEDWAGLKVTATYSDGTTSVVTPDSITGFDSSVAVDSQTITVTYKGKSTSFSIKIKAETDDDDEFTRAAALKYMHNVLILFGLAPNDTPNYDFINNWTQTVIFTEPTPEGILNDIHNDDALWQHFYSALNALPTEGNYGYNKDYSDRANSLVWMYINDFEDKAEQILNSAAMTEILGTWNSLREEYEQNVTGSLYGTDTPLAKYYNSLTPSETMNFEDSSLTDEELEECYNSVKDIIGAYTKNGTKEKACKDVLDAFVSEFVPAVEAKTDAAFELIRECYTSDIYLSYEGDPINNLRTVVNTALSEAELTYTGDYVPSLNSELEKRLFGVSVFKRFYLYRVGQTNYATTEYDNFKSVKINTDTKTAYTPSTETPNYATQMRVINNWIAFYIANGRYDDTFGIELPDRMTFDKMRLLGYIAKTGQGYIGVINGLNNKLFDRNNTNSGSYKNIARKILEELGENNYAYSLQSWSKDGYGNDWVAPFDQNEEAYINCLYQLLTDYNKYKAAFGSDQEQTERYTEYQGKLQRCELSKKYVNDYYKDILVMIPYFRTDTSTYSEFNSNFKNSFDKFAEMMWNFRQEALSFAVYNNFLSNEARARVDAATGSGFTALKVDDENKEALVKTFGVMFTEDAAIIPPNWGVTDSFAEKVDGVWKTYTIIKSSGEN